MSDVPEAGTKECPSCAETVKAAAHVCRYCGHSFDVPPPPPATPPMASPAMAPPPMPVPAAAPPAEPKHRGRMIVVKLLAVVGVLALVFIGIAIYFATRPEASSPSDLVKRFDEAGVTCRSTEIIYNDRDQKALGCVTQDSQVVTITTYGDRPSPDSWLSSSCAARSPQSNQSGYYVVGDGFIIDMTQGAYPESLGAPTPIDQTAQALAKELDGTATAYDCTKDGG